MNFQSIVILVSFVLLFNIINGTHSEPMKETEGRVHKCCGEYELFVGKSCVHRKQTNETLWYPIFTLENEQLLKSNISITFSFSLVTGPPDCGSRQTLTFYQYYNSTQWFRFLPSGVLRHYSTHPMPEGDEDESKLIVMAGIDVFYHDFEPGKYCADKVVDGQRVGNLAQVCAPKQNDSLRQIVFLMRNIISPITHSLSIICFLTIAIICFKMTNLRDLVGNIIITICMCLIVSQSSDIIRLLTLFNGHITLIITETICYISLLGSSFWLNSLGYYVWKTFKSRNVSLDITEKKYCYYSAYAWSCTIILGVLAGFAHILIDYPEVNGFLKLQQQREQIGFLGIIICFVPVAFTVIINVFFFATTLRTINRMQAYETIHHKLRHSFRMFLMLLLTMTITWLFFLSSFTKYDGLINCHIIVNAFQGPLILYVCVYDQKHVAYLFRKSCCYKFFACACCQSKQSKLESGDEITVMNTGSY